MSRGTDRAFALRFQAAIQDEVAQRRNADGQPVGDALAKVRALRVEAD